MNCTDTGKYGHRDGSSTVPKRNVEGFRRTVFRLIIRWFICGLNESDRFGKRKQRMESKESTGN